MLHPATARSVERLLEAVVEEGTAKRAQIPGYRVAGKTGTPQKLSESGRGYSNSAYMASFVGFAPARRPAVVCLVMIDEPEGGAEGGAQGLHVLVERRPLALRGGGVAGEQQCEVLGAPVNGAC